MKTLLVGVLYKAYEGLFGAGLPVEGTHVSDDAEHRGYDIEELTSSRIDEVLLVTLHPSAAVRVA